MFSSVNGPVAQVYKNNKVGNWKSPRQIPDGRLETKNPCRWQVKSWFAVEDTGSREGDKLAQVYFRYVHSRVPQPTLALCGFARMHLKHSESSRVTVAVSAERLRNRDTEKKQCVVEPGKHEFLISAVLNSIRLTLPMKSAAQ